MSLENAVPFFDFHCHLDLFPNPKEAFDHCQRSNIVTLTVTTTPRAWVQNCGWANGNPYVLPALGLHPELVESQGNEVELLLDTMDRVAIIGEVGLDGSPRYRDSYDRQLSVFSRVVGKAAEEPGRILSLHSRAAVKDVLRLLKPHAAALRPILHWFSGTPSELRQAIDIGCYFSVNGSMTRSKRGEALVRLLPLDRLLTETDGPFRRSAGTASKREADLRSTISAIAQVKGLDDAEIVNQVRSNANGLVELSLA